MMTPVLMEEGLPMNSIKLTSILCTGLLAGSFLLGGCNRTESDLRSMTDEAQQRGTAMVRGADAATMAGCQNMMMQKLGQADAKYDQRFIDTLVQHHQSGVQLAQDAMQKATHPELKKLAQNIINTNQQEINKLQSLESQWYGTTVPSTGEPTGALEPVQSAPLQPEPAQ
jgi:hypothetical protein